MDDYNKLMKQLEAFKAMQGEQQEIPLRPEEEMTPAVDTSAKNELIQEPTTPELKQLATPERKVASVMPEQEIQDVNKEMKSDHLKTKEEKQGIDVDQKYMDLIKRYESELDAPKKERSWEDSLPDALAGLHNILNYGSGSRQKMMKMDHLKNLEAREAANSKARTDKVSDLTKLLGNYKKLKGGTDGKVYQTRSGLVKLDEQGNPTEIYKDPYMQSGAKVREESLDLRREKLKNTQSQKFQDDAAKAVDSMRKTDSWKEAEKALSSIPNIEVLLEDAYQKGGQSLSMLGPRIAKGIAGEVGVLTEQDVTRYVKNPQLAEGLMDSISKINSGKLTETSYENIKRLLDISKKASQDKMDMAVMREASLLSKREGIDIEEAYRLLDDTYKADMAGIERIKETKKASGKVEVQLPDGRKGKIDASKVDAFMKKYPKAKVIK